MHSFFIYQNIITMAFPVTWFEIACKDLDRAKGFYSKVFKSEFQFIDMGPDKMEMFKGTPEGGGAGGALVLSKENTPSTDGCIIYFSCEDCGVEAGRVEEAGGKLLMPKTSIGEFGWIAQFIDTEGNRVGMHSSK